MKNLTLLLFVSMSLFACKKDIEQPFDKANEVHIIGPQDVHFKVHSRTDATKRIQIELWSVKEKTQIKDKLVGSIDTLISTQGDFVAILTQNVRPVMYCVASLKVSVLNQRYDTLSLSIGSKDNNLIGRSYSCQTDYLDIQETYLHIR